MPYKTKPGRFFRAWAILALLFFVSGHAQEFYTGVWRSGADGHFLWSGESWADFNKKWDELAKVNLRLINIKTYKVGGKRYFSGVWRAGSDAYGLTPLNLDWTAFNTFWSDNSKKGLRLINVETYTENGSLYFLGVFRAGSDAHGLTPLNLDWAAFNTFWSDNSKKGMRLVNIETYLIGGKRCFLGVFRAGSDGYVLSPYGGDWNQLVKDWTDLAAKNLRLIDLETFLEGGKRIYLGVWREGTDGHYLWGGTDWESFSSKWAENGAGKLRLIDMETYAGSCNGDCLNHALLPDNPNTSGREDYDYRITAGPQHCERLPGTCPIPVSSDVVVYRWPNLKVGNDYYVRNSVLYDAKDQIFTLPFKVPSSDIWHNAWLYSPGSWHHAIDYQRNDRKTFQIVAAAPGKVIHVGWDWWSGTTMVISHDAGGKKDVYRTIYMHLQNGPDQDCENAWSKTMPFFDAKDKADYSAYLEATGCTSDKKKRNPKADWWGTAAKKIDMGLLGKTVAAGQAVAWSGSTGPGGCGCMPSGAGPNTHLHIFFAHRDPSDRRWYFIDPYGLYAFPSCYPTPADGAFDKACARYPSTWKGGKPGYAP